MTEKNNRPARNRAAEISWGDCNHYSGPRRRSVQHYAPPVITVTEFQTWEIRRHLAATDPAYLRELEAAA